MSGATSNAKPFYVGVPFDSLKTHPKVRIDFHFSVKYYNRLAGLTWTTWLDCAGLGNVTWGSDGFTAKVSDLVPRGSQQTRTGTVKVTLSPDGTRIVRVELNYVNLAPSYENVQYVAENIPSRSTAAYGTNLLLLEYYVKGYDAMQSVTRQLTATITPTTTAEPILGFSPETDSYITIVIWDFDVS